MPNLGIIALAAEGESPGLDRWAAADPGGGDIAVLRERRMSIRLMGAWWDWRGERPFPAPEDFQGEDLAGIWPYCFTLAVADEPTDSSFEYIGPAMAEASRLTSRPARLSDVPSGCLLSHATRSLEQVLESKVPAVSSGDFVDPDGTTFVYRSILLPTGRDGTNIDSLVGGARCKAIKPR